MKYTKYILIFFLFLLTPFLLFAAFEHDNWSARASAMGNAFVGLADDGTAIFYNPAGIGQLKYNELNGMFTWLHTGLDIKSLDLSSGTVAVPVQAIGAFGIGWASFSAASLYRENTIILCFAKKLNEIPSIKKKLNFMDLYAGINIKYIGHSYLMADWVDDPIFEGGNSQYALALDAGLLAKIYLKKLQNYFRMGLAIFNINQPDVGLYLEDPIPYAVKFGISYPLQDNSFFQLLKMEKPVPAVAVVYRDKAFNFHIGWENRFLYEILGFRIGTTLKEFSTGLGIKLISSYFLFELNYAFLFPFHIERTSGSHKASLMVRF